MQALPSEQPIKWRDTAELKDLFSVYVGRPTEDAKQTQLQQILGISDADAISLRDVVTTGEFHLEQGRKEEAFF